MTTKNLTLTVALLFTGVAAFAQNPTPLLNRPADQLITVLKSDASQKDKADACRELAVIGGKDAVPALAALLADEKLNHMARYALETIADASAEAALLDASGKLNGRPLVGVIGSLGVRKDAKAVQPLSGLLGAADPDVAQAAARALGSLGTEDAAKAIQKALPTTAAGNQLAFCEGLFRCAETMSAKGQSKPALALYAELRDLKGLPHQVRAGATRGAILAAGKNGMAMLKESLASNDYIVFAAAVRAALEIPGSDVTQTLLGALPKLRPDNQFVVISALGKRGDDSALRTLFAKTGEGEKTVRLAAIRAIAEIGKPAVVPELVGLMANADREIAQAAHDAFASVPGPEADAAVTAMLNSADAAKRIAGLDLIARRRMTASTPALLKATGDSDSGVRTAAFKRLGELGGAGEVQPLLRLLSSAKEARDVDAAEQALSAICARQSQPDASVDKVLGALASAQPAQKAALLRVLGAVGGAKALEGVRSAVGDSNAEVKGAALRALAAWKTPDAAPTLLSLAKGASDPTDKLVCLRGYFGWAGNSDVPAERRLAMCREGTALAQSVDEKKLLLGALGSIKTVEAVALVTPYLDDAATKEEASAAVVSIAQELLKGDQGAPIAAKLIEPLQKAAQATTNEDLAKRAKDQLQRAQAKAGAKAE
jgi:HEAT repeat protein